MSDLKSGVQFDHLSRDLQKYDKQKESDAAEYSSDFDILKEIFIYF